MKLVITDTIFDEFPELVLGIVILHNIDNSQNRAEITEMLRQAEAALPGKFGSTTVIEHPYIATWREAYRKFGAKPKDYPSSVENLTRRVLNGATIEHINNLVLTFRPFSVSRHQLAWAWAKHRPMWVCPTPAGCGVAMSRVAWLQTKLQTPFRGDRA